MYGQHKSVRTQSQRGRQRKTWDDMVGLVVADMLKKIDLLCQEVKANASDRKQWRVIAHN